MWGQDPLSWVTPRACVAAPSHAHRTNTPMSCLSAAPHRALMLIVATQNCLVPKRTSETQTVGAGQGHGLFLLQHEGLLMLGFPS